MSLLFLLECGESFGPFDTLVAIIDNQSSADIIITCYKAKKDDKTYLCIHGQETIIGYFGYYPDKGVSQWTDYYDNVRIETTDGRSIKKDIYDKSQYLYKNYLLKDRDSIQSRFVITDDDIAVNEL